MATTPVHEYPAEPSQPKTTHKRNRKSRQARTSEGAPTERRTVFDRLEPTPRVQPTSSRPRIASLVRAESSRSSATSSTAGTRRMGASGKTHPISRQHQERLDGKAPMDLNNPPRHVHLGGHTERSENSRSRTNRNPEGRNPAGSHSHHRTISRGDRSVHDNTIVLYDQFTGMPTMYQPVDDGNELRQPHRAGSRREQPEPSDGVGLRHQDPIEQRQRHHKEPKEHWVFRHDVPPPTVPIIPSP